MSADRAAVEHRIVRALVRARDPALDSALRRALHSRVGAQGARNAWALQLVDEARVFLGERKSPKRGVAQSADGTAPRKVEQRLAISMRNMNRDDKQISSELETLMQRRQAWIPAARAGTTLFSAISMARRVSSFYTWSLAGFVSQFRGAEKYMT